MSGHWRFTRSKGYLTLYLCLILMVVLTISASMQEAVQRYYEFGKDLEEFRRINVVEIMTINYIKQEFRDFSEKDTEFDLLECHVSIVYEGLTANIYIRSSSFERKRTLIFDDLNDIIFDYY